ncbi:hypothetical protein GCM10027452_43400 [Micromonospora halotolerans]
MGSVSRLFDTRDTLARMLLLDLSGLGYLVVGAQGHQSPTTTQWALALTAFAAAPLFHRRPLVNLVAQAALLAVAFTLVDDTTINQVGASWALLELVMRAERSRTIWLAAGLLVAVDLTDSIGDPVRRMLSGVFGLTVEVGVPLLLGLLIRTSRELARQAEERAAAEQRRRESESRAARADERSAIARELHDVVAHHITMIALQAEAARLATPGLPPEGARRLTAIGDTARVALTEMRRLLGVLREDVDAEPTRRPQPGLRELNALLDEVRDAAVGSGVRLIVSGSVEPLDPGVELTAYRIVQEALTNARRHAPGAAVDVELHYRGEDLSVRVYDNGPGPAPAPASPTWIGVPCSSVPETMSTS